MSGSGTKVAVTRRQMLGAVGGAAIATAVMRTAAAAQAAAPAPLRPGAAPAGAFGTPPATDIRTELRRLSPSVLAFLQREAPGQSNFSVSNFGIVEGPKSLLAIDAGGGPQHARNFLKAAQTLGKPVDRVVITHEHPDHSVGLTQFPAGIEIIAQEETRAQMVRMGTPATPAYWKTNPAWGNADDVNRVVLPTVTFHDRMSLYYGDTKVDFLWPGRAHTSGDALIYVRAARSVFMGDIAFFGVTPLASSGFMQDWLKVCDAVLQDPEVEVIVPGHGPVGGKKDLVEMRDYLALLLREGRKGLDAGIGAGRAAAELDLGKYASWTDPDRVVNNMARVYSELKGTIGTDGDREATRQATAEYNQLKRR
jgi:cyclase